MDTKTCPECGTEVPEVANRCKECFHDFSHVPQSKALSNITFLLSLLAIMSLIGTATLWYVRDSAEVVNITIDAETSSIIFAKTLADQQSKTQRIRFEDIAQIEYITGGNIATYVIEIITISGDRLLYAKSNDAPLLKTANHINLVTKRPLKEIQKARGFESLNKANKN